MATDDPRPTPEVDRAPELVLLRAAYLLGRTLLGPLDLLARGGSPAPPAAPAIGGHAVHRLRVLLATLGSWLEGADPRWLRELRDADADLHRVEVAAVGAAGSSRRAQEAEATRAAADARLCEALRAADRVTFGRREVDLHGAALLTGASREALRAAIASGDLPAVEDRHGPRIGLAALAAFAGARGLPWEDGLADPAAGEAREAALRILLGLQQG